ncbi:serine/threonine protein kinase [Granulicella tundricola MP5ACTX9]|uniref:Serine/threonine protein kinase n=2 Tax=Granulicella TaxID=940557 RepID=E8WZ73_GRATM|nr:serine/threonine protein kinase [Granulicella tundricola MP5ACTX9]
MEDDLTVAFVNVSGDGAAATPAPAPVTLKTWGRFELLARVGEGGFGEVYRAWDPDLQREVALKLLLPSAMNPNLEYEEVLREARAMAAVRHLNVVPIYGIDRQDGRVGFWTDFVHGVTLAALLEQQGPFGYREAALIGLDVAHALSAVHKSGLLHRDIKAENVMREEGGRILLMDFGLSSLAQQAHGLAGTPAYMAPELFTGAVATVGTDLYAVGVLLFYLVAGKHPVPFLGFQQEQLDEAQRQRLFLPDLRPDLPESFLRVVNVASDPDPKRRFGTAGQLSAALSEVLGGTRVVEADQAAAAVAVPVKPMRRWLWFGLAGVLVLLLVAGLVWRERVTNGVTAGAAGVSASNYETYSKAQDLVVHSYLNRNLAAAIDGFNQVLKNDPGFALAEAGLGRAYFLQYHLTRNQESLDKAQAATKRALELDANCAPAYVTLARISTTGGNTSLALQQVAKALELEPLNAEAYAAKADVFAAERRDADAKEALSHAVDLAPDDWRFPVLLGNYEFAAGNLQEAVTLYKRGAELAPDNVIAFYNLGDTQEKLGQLGEAQASFEKALKIEPRFAIYSALGGLLSLEGKHAEAIRMGQKAVELNPGDYNTRQNLAEAYLWSPGGREQAMATYREAIGLAEHARLTSPRDPALLISLAYAYALTGDKGKSLPLIRQSLALSPDDPDVSLRAGVTYEVLGQRAEALRLVAKALAGSYSPVWVEHNPELAGLRSDPGFGAALAKAKSKGAGGG